MEATASKVMMTAGSEAFPKILLPGSAKLVNVRCPKWKLSDRKRWNVNARVRGAPRLNGSKAEGNFFQIWKKSGGAGLMEDVGHGLAEQNAFRLGRLVEEDFVYRQTFVIRSYEVGADMCGSIETIMNHLQETALNHACAAGLAGDGFGATPEMTHLNLIWVVTRMQVQVDHYPSWGDIVEIDTWVAASGKNSMRRDWLVRDYRTGQILTRATSTWVMMNRETRRLSKFPEAVKQEIFPYYLERSAIGRDDAKKLDKLANDTAQYIHSGLTPKWSDLDVNRHVNNVKYIGWILESVPVSVLENHELANMTLEYKRECGRSNVLQSLTSLRYGNDDLMDSKSTVHFSYASGSSNICNSLLALQCSHLLRLENDGAEIVRGRTEWRPKGHKN